MYGKTLSQLTTLFMLIAYASSQCCQQFSDGICSKCPSGMHLYRHNCLFDVPNCIEYDAGFDCAKCKKNYLLENGQCQHHRFNIQKEKLGFFQPYMHSGFRPDPIFIDAQTQLINNKQIWYSWYNHSAIQNRTFLTTSTLKRRSNNLRFRILPIPPAPQNAPYYICTTDFMHAGVPLTLYRLTYQVTSPFGFADLTFAIETQGQSIGYMEIINIKYSQLSQGNWQSLSLTAADKIGKQLSKYFTSMEDQTYLNGFWMELNQGYNITLFYLDAVKGVNSYKYQGGKQDLEALGVKDLSSPIPKKDQPINNLNLTEDQKKGRLPVIEGLDGMSLQQEEQVEKMVALSAFETNPVYSVGFAVAVQQGYATRKSQIKALSKFPSNDSYCLYLKQMGQKQIVHLKLIFFIDLATNEFKIVSYQQSNKTLIPEQKKAVQPRTSQPSPSQQSVDTASPETSPKDKHQGITLNQTAAAFCPQMSKFHNISLEIDLQKDLFLPKIHLLLFKMYGKALTNCEMSEAKYSWIINKEAVVSTIRYNITYTCVPGYTLQFVTEIVNNQLRIIKIPEGIEEGKEYVKPTEIQINNQINKQQSQTIEIVPSSPQAVTIQNKTKIPQPNQDNNASKIKNSTVPPNSAYPLSPTQGLDGKSPGGTSIPANKNSTSNKPSIVIIDQTRPSSFFNNLGNSTPPTNINTTVKKEEVKQKTRVPIQTYKQNSPLRNLVNIAKGSKGLPNNSTIQLIETWKDSKGNQYYHLVYHMPYIQPLSDGSTIKVYTFTQILFQSNKMGSLIIPEPQISYIKDTRPLLSSYPPPNQNQNSYTDLLAELLKKDSPFLQNFAVNSTQLNQFGEDFEGLRVRFQQKLTFESSAYEFCYRIQYHVIKLAKEDKRGKVKIDSYRLVDCHKESTPTTEIKFDSTSLNAKMTARIQQIGGSSVTQQIQEKFLKNYKITFVTQLNIQYEVIINEETELVLSFKVKPQVLLTPTLKNIDNNWFSSLQKQLKQQLSIKQGVLSIYYIQKVGSNSENKSLLQVLLLAKSNKFGAFISSHYLIEIVQSEGSISIVKQTTFNIADSHAYQINHNDLKNYHQVSWNVVVKTNQFSKIAADIQNEFPFLKKDCEYITFLVNNSSTQVNFFNTSYQKDVNVKLLISKKYTQSVFTYYIVSITYNPSSQATVLTGIAALPSNSFKVNQCQKTVNRERPMCYQCLQTFTLTNGACFQRIPYCKEQYEGLCLRCQIVDPYNSITSCISIGRSRADDFSIVTKYFEGVKDANF